MFYTIYLKLSRLFKKIIINNNTDTNFIKVNINDKYRCPV